MATIKSIEEKAKAYDEALERANEMIKAMSNIGGVAKVDDIQHIFPELKESEDEKIRNVLVDYFKKYKEQEECGIKTFFGIPTDNIIAWLEKQGEQKSEGKSALEAINEEKVDNANKVEPKFKVGDWISGYYTNYKVLSVNNDGYLVEDVDGNKINILFENEKFHHLFTIADAKDGDVLNSPSCHLIWIYKDSEHYHACLNMNYVTENTSIGGSIKIPSDACPATKEQSNVLMKAMANAGYTFDFDKKELKKIEQKEVIHNELTEFEKAVKQVMEEAIECGDTHNLKADAEMLLSLAHNSSWSEEDEYCRHQLIVFCENCMVQDAGAKRCAHWLKSLKGRVQPQNGYNPYKEVVESIAEMCKHYDKASHSGLQDFYDNVKVKCKDAKEYDSLYPQNTWKPSDKQIKVLEFFIPYVTECSVVLQKSKDTLLSLLTDLKKLREE